MSNEDNEDQNQREHTNGNGADVTDEQLRADLDKVKKDYLYLAADFDNFRKNAIKERSDLIKFGNERLIRELLNVVDNFERALESGADPQKFREGIELINTEMKSLLQRFGVAEVPAQGEVFDPTAHEALSSEPTSDMLPGRILRVFKKAYKLHDRLIRPAQVVVSSKLEQPS
jgi:molecular chaperone GrpE